MVTPTDSERVDAFTCRLNPCSYYYASTSPSFLACHMCNNSLCPENWKYITTRTTQVYFCWKEVHQDGLVASTSNSSGMQLIHPVMCHHQNYVQENCQNHAIKNTEKGEQDRSCYTRKFSPLAWSCLEDRTLAKRALKNKVASVWFWWSKAYFLFPNRPPSSAPQTAPLAATLLRLPPDPVPVQL